MCENNVTYCNMSEEKDDLESIKVYKLNNMKEGWHEFALKFRVIVRELDSAMCFPIFEW